jgi:hypothetical protein
LRTSRYRGDNAFPLSLGVGDCIQRQVVSCPVDVCQASPCCSSPGFYRFRANESHIKINPTGKHRRAENWFNKGISKRRCPNGKKEKGGFSKQAEAGLVHLREEWGDKYAIAVRSWENNWEELATFFDYPAEVRRLIYTTNTIEGYNRQLRKVTKNKASFPSREAVCKLLYLANVNILKKWTRPISNWPKILNQLAIRFEDRFPV